MALMIDATDEIRGGTHSDAYHKLAYLRWSDVDNKVMAVLSVFSTATAEAEGKEVISSVELDVTDLFPDIQEKVYGRIKRMNSYTSALDV